MLQEASLDGLDSLDVLEPGESRENVAFLA